MKIVIDCRQLLKKASPSGELLFPKATRGNAVARVVQVPTTYAYVDELLNVVVNLREH